MQKAAYAVLNLDTFLPTIHLVNYSISLHLQHSSVLLSHNL